MTSIETIRRGRPGYALVALAALLATGCRPQAAGGSAPPPAGVDVAQVVSRQVEVWDEFNGRVSAPQTVTVRPRVGGYIERVAFQDGSEVNKGDLLFVIDQRPYRAALQAAKAQQEKARAAVVLAQTRSRRAQSLIASDAVSREEVDSTDAALRQANAELSAAEAVVANASLNLDYTEVKAPVAGRVGRAQLTVGNLAQADQSVLTSLVSQDPMYVYFDCDEHSYLYYQELARNAGKQAKGALPVRIALVSEEGYPHAGHVDFTDNQIDPATGTVRVRAVLANRDRALTPGLYARVQLQGRGKVAARLIDDRAVLTDQNRKYVYVLGADGKAHRKDVVLGRQVEGLRLVQSGLAEKDEIVVTGTQKIMRDGAPVKANHVAMDANVVRAAGQAAAASVTANAVAAN